MHAIVAREPGGPDVFEWSEVPTPAAGPGEVLIEVTAAGVNRADTLQRRGLYPPPPGGSSIIGLECSGRIAATGDGVTRWRIGDEVCALLSGGGYAEYVAVDAGQVLPVPSGVDLAAAAGLPEVACTVWSNVIMRAGLRTGESLLIHGGASGIGTMAIQIARALGVRTLVTAGSREKLQRCAELGAEVLINYRDDDFVDVVRRETAGQGVDVILDNMGAAYLGRNVQALAFDGRLVIIGLQGGTASELDINALLRKCGSLHATTLRGRPTSQKAQICAEVEHHVWPWIAAGLIHPVIDRMLPMQEAGESHRVLEAGETVGKVLLQLG